MSGDDERNSACRDLPPTAKRVERAGGHHLDGDYRALGDIIAGYFRE